MAIYRKPKFLFAAATSAMELAVTGPGTAFAPRISMR
jgi:hypothetical protein